jgi:hypothetical protein
LKYILDPSPRPTWAIALIAATLALAGCSSTVVDAIPNWVGGEPADAPARPATTAEYPPVNDRPPPRDAKLITEQEQAKLEGELNAARAKQAAAALETQKDRQEVFSSSTQWTAAQEKAEEARAAAAKSAKAKNKPQNSAAN